MIKVIRLCFVVLLLGLQSRGDGPEQEPRRTGAISHDPMVIGCEVVDNLLQREPRLYIGKHAPGLHYAEICSAVGALRLAENMNDKALIDRIVDHYSGLLDPEEGNPMITRRRHVDHSVMGSLPLEIYLATGDERYFKLGLTFADSQWENPRENGLTAETRWWVDDMYMVGMVQMQAFRASGDRKYADRAALQIDAYNKKLQQPNGLFYHGPEHPFSWGRGNGWVAASMAELLRSMPEDQPLRPVIMDSYRKMMAALLKYQSDNGMWRQVVDYEYAWAESSCTAMFAYAMTVGVDHGWLDQESYGPAVDKAWKALCAHVDPLGNVREICIGTSRRDYLEYYLKRPRELGDLHGQAPFLWLAAERLEMKK
ncbi:MAG: glycoside hydrolase family 88 protein [Pontiellaceae bacterium]|nr:glycoside hydrolase family 88 protein [Pontiellaceae bacterium]MBN2784500.1 glycoside hydrolase family 88 protein [Pontiellaceae bacterium]